MSDTLKVTVGEGDDAKTYDAPVEAVQLPEGYRILKPGQAPEGFIPKDFMEKEIQRRSKAYEGLVKPDDLLSDHDFFRKAATRHGIELGEDLKPKSKFDPAQVEAMRSQWREEEVKPLKEQVETYQKTLRQKEQGEIGTALERAMNADSTRIRKDLRISLTPGRAAPIVRDLLDRFERDDDRGVYFFRDQAGNPVYSDQPTQENPYAGPEKLLAMLKAQGVDIFEHTGPQATPLGQTNGRATSTDTRKWSALPEAERMKFIAEHGHEAVKKRLLAEKGH